VTHVTLARGRCFRSRNALDRTVLVRRRGTFFIAISNAETFLRMNSINSLSLSLLFFEEYLFVSFPFLNLDARARGFTPQHSLTLGFSFFHNETHSFGARNSGFGHSEHEILRGESGNTRPGEQRCASSKTKNGDEGSVRPPHQLFGRI